MKKVMSVAVASVLFGTVSANAHVPEAEWEQFKAQFSAMSQRMTALEAENQQLRAASKSLGGRALRNSSSAASETRVAGAPQRVAGGHAPSSYSYS